MKTENISTLKIHKLTQEQYERELEAGNIDETALYFTQDDFDEEELREFITSEDDTIKSEYIAAISNAKTQLSGLITTLKESVNGDISTLTNNITNITKTLSEAQGKLNNLETALEGKVDSEFIIPWANYDGTTVDIGVSGSSYCIKSTPAALEIYNDQTKITYWEDGNLIVTNISVTDSININGLTIQGNDTTGWYFR